MLYVANCKNTLYLQIKNWTCSCILLSWSCIEYIQLKHVKVKIPQRQPEFGNNAKKWKISSAAPSWQLQQLEWPSYPQGIPGSPNKISRAPRRQQPINGLFLYQTGVMECAPNGCHLTDYTFKWIFMNGIFLLLIQVSLWYVYEGLATSQHWFIS